MFNPGLEIGDDKVEKMGNIMLPIFTGKLDSNHVSQNKTESEENSNATQKTCEEEPSSRTLMFLGYLLAFLSGVCFTSM